jgi:hypothetical protein
MKIDKYFQIKYILIKNMLRRDCQYKLISEITVTQMITKVLYYDKNLKKYIYHYLSE